MMLLMCRIVGAPAGRKAGKEDQERRTMTFGEKDFLIEAYALDTTDRLATAQALSRRASLAACVLRAGAWEPITPWPWWLPLLRDARTRILCSYCPLS